MNPQSRENDLPVIHDEQINLLERLCNACAVSGDEGEVRLIVLEQVRAAVSSRGGEIKSDALGNVLVTRPASASGQGAPLRVMVAAHMDEIGFMITQDEDKGYYRFDTVGGIDLRTIAGKPVWIGHDHIPGVIGVKAIHLLQPDERSRAPSLDSLRIDVGPGNSKVKLGDRATFATPFARLGPSLRAKALDNRLGVAILIELVKNPPPNIELLAAFTVQEEVGLRGARVAAYHFNPDLAIALDSTPAYDMPSQEDLDAGRVENTTYNSRLDHGPAIYLADSSTISDPRLVRHMADTAEARGIPYQFRQPGGGGTDAGAIHKTRAGIPSISISTPVRYFHTPASIARISDWQHTWALVYAALGSLTPAVLSAER
ncbi:MAG: M42 family peptidase [Chloroflexota bacterium]|nr:MAG: M42 family peptidase [Chloroflexota bacterium]